MEKRKSVSVRTAPQKLRVSFRVSLALSLCLCLFRCIWSPFSLSLPLLLHPSRLLPACFSPAFAASLSSAACVRKRWRRRRGCGGVQILKSSVWSPILRSVAGNAPTRRALTGMSIGRPSERHTGTHNMSRTEENRKRKDEDEGKRARDGEGNVEQGEIREKGE